tara:strand:- start:96897 stop:97343 length:447 start_codon:yes stop_codon:yes gene_type:complete
MKKAHLFFLLFINLNLVVAQNEIVNKPVNQTNGIGLEGFDAVSYFKGHPLKGNEQIKAEYNGVIYFFNSMENKNKFIENPVAYLPAYGGWCAYAMGDNGELVSINPETFKIIDGKLYLFYNAFFNNTLKKWNKDETTLLKNADLNWKK